MNPGPPVAPSGRFRWVGLALLLVLPTGLTLLFPPIPQPDAYHDFADQRRLFGLVNALDTLSNLPFLLVGAAGLLRLAGAGAVFVDPREAGPYRLFFLALVLVGLGSGYYHLAPDNTRLVWDRAAMALAFMALVAALLGERVSLRAGRRALPLLLAAGQAAVWYWGWSEGAGRGDLRPYLLLQGGTLLLLAWLLWAWPPRYSGGRTLLGVLGLYLLALLLDFGDRAVFALSGGWVSGHTLKHLAAALAAGLLLRHLGRRRVLIKG